MKIQLAGLFAAPLALLLGCGDDTPRGIGKSDTTLVTDTAVGTDITDTDVAVVADVAVGQDVAADTTTVTFLPNACDAGTPCTRGSCYSGVCIEAPPEGLTSTLTDPSTALPSDIPVNLSCADQTLAAPVETKMTTVAGALARFGSGRLTTGLRVDFILADGFDPTPCEAIADHAAQKTCFRALGPIVGTATTTSRVLDTVLPTTCTHHEECPVGYQCYDPHDLSGTCEEQFGVYEIVGLPLDTRLIVRSYPLTVNDQDRWHDTWMFNVVLTSDAEADGKVPYDAQIVSASQWQTTTNSVGLSDIPITNGGIGGRVRDCHDGTRESWPITDVRINLAQKAQKVIYFNNLEDDTVPLVDRETTNIHGRFAALDIPSGWNAIAGVARIAGELRTIGAQRIYIFPDSLTIASWPGYNPFWRQKD